MLLSEYLKLLLLYYITNNMNTKFAGSGPYLSVERSTFWLGFILLEQNCQTVFQ